VDVLNALEDGVDLGEAVLGAEAQPAHPARRGRRLEVRRAASDGVRPVREGGLVDSRTRPGALAEGSEA
jgi:hypothetical protein